MALLLLASQSPSCSPPTAPELWVSWAPCSVWEADLSGVPNPAAPRPARWGEALERRRRPGGGWEGGQAGQSPEARDPVPRASFSQAGTAKAQPHWARVCPDAPASESGELLAGPHPRWAHVCPEPQPVRAGGCWPGLSAEWELVARRGPSGERDQPPGRPPGEGLRDSPPPAWPEPAA